MTGRCKHGVEHWDLPSGVSIVPCDECSNELFLKTKSRELSAMYLPEGTKPLTVLVSKIYKTDLRVKRHNRVVIFHLLDGDAGISFCNAVDRERNGIEMEIKEGIPRWMCVCRRCEALAAIPQGEKMHGVTRLGRYEEVNRQRRREALE